MKTSSTSSKCAGKFWRIGEWTFDVKFDVGTGASSAGELVLELETVWRKCGSLGFPVCGRSPVVGDGVGVGGVWVCRCRCCLFRRCCLPPGIDLRFCACWSVVFVGDWRTWVGVSILGYGWPVGLSRASWRMLYTKRDDLKGRRF